MFIDVEDSSGRLDPDLMTLRSNLYQVVGDAFTRTSLSSARWHHEDRGDGIIFLIDSTVPKIDIVGPLLDHLVTGLRRHNEGKPLQEWMRLRVALHAGEVQRDNKGWGGDALTMTFRMSEAPAVKKALVATPRAQCIIVVSNELFQAVIRHGHPLANSDAYHPISVSLRDRSTQAWVRVPGYATLPHLPVADPTLAPDPALTLDPTLAARHISIRAGTVKSLFNDKVDVGRDLNIG
jgi:hypothetical protein